MPERGTSKSVLKETLICRKCGATWKYTGITVATKCPYCGAFKDARLRKFGDSSYTAKNYEQSRANLDKHKKNRDARLASSAKARQLLKKRVFFQISGSIIPKCVRCGCDDPRLLEINHKNGGGGKEIKEYLNASKSPVHFLYDILSGKRATDDLELLCRPCNAVHALELRFGPLPMKVVWTGAKVETQPDAEQFFSLEELTRGTSISIDSARRYVRAGVIQGEKIGSLYYVQKGEWDRYLRSIQGGEIYEEQLLSISQIVEIYGVSPHKIRRCIRLGIIQSQYDGRYRHYVKRGEIEKYLAIHGKGDQRRGNK